MPTDNDAKAYASLAKESSVRHCDAICTKCGKQKRPTRAYMALLKFSDAPYICQACRSSVPPPAMKLGTLGYL